MICDNKDLSESNGTHILVIISVCVQFTGKYETSSESLDNWLQNDVWLASELIIRICKEIVKNKKVTIFESFNLLYKKKSAKLKSKKRCFHVSLI